MLKFVKKLRKLVEMYFKRKAQIAKNSVCTHFVFKSRQQEVAKELNTRSIETSFMFSHLFRMKPHWVEPQHLHWAKKLRRKPSADGWRRRWVA